MKTFLFFTTCSLVCVAAISAEESETEGKRPFIGVQLIDVDKKLAKETNCPVRSGAMVLEAIEDGAAKKAGLKEGDIISRINGVGMGSAKAVTDWLKKTEDGKKYGLTVYRQNDAGKWSKLVLHMTVEFVSNDTPPPKFKSVKEIIEGVDWRAWEEKQAQLPPEQRPFEIKGDLLGMPLDIFKSKYHRVVKGNDQPAPFCSDKNPDKDLSTLLYKAEYNKAGIVHGRTTFPFEEYNSANPNVATIAGVKADPFVYKFVDGKLYEMTIFFSHDDYAHVIDAVAAKYGNSTLKETRTYQNAFGAKFDGDVTGWENPLSEIVVFERAGDVDSSLMLVTHKELWKLARSRIEADKKAHLKDDL